MEGRAKQSIWFLLRVAPALLLLSWCGLASAIDMDFMGDGTGSLLVSPVVYGGNITWGDLAPGVWDLTIDDGGWPDPSDPGARWDYIWDTYYAPNYDPDAHIWIATFDSTTCATVPRVYLEHTGVGHMSGVAKLRMQVSDDNGNGVLDAGEICEGDFSGLVIIIKDGSGDYAGYCGDGYFFGSYTKPGCPPEMTDYVQLLMHLNVDDCAVSIASSTWGKIKLLYE